MAAIRIIDTWLRSPASPPSHWRSVMVVAEKWAEQRVLMRAYADSRDQMLPTIMLYGMELAIGPAGTDSNGAWGVHVGEPDERRSHDIKHHLEEAARRIAGSKGNPPRLMDEDSTFDREPTANWSPGAPRIVPKREGGTHPDIEHVTPITAARVPRSPSASYRSPHPQVVHHAPEPSRPRTRTRQPVGVKGTALGYSSGAGAQSAIVRLGLTPGVSARLGRFVDRIVPAEFQIDADERRVLNALGEKDLSARAIGQMIDESDAVTFMEELTRKLEQYHLDIVEPGEPSGNEPTYRLRS